MQVPVDITFRGMEPSQAVDAAVRHCVERLHTSPRVLRCDVVIELPHHSQRHGQAFHVRIDLAVPGRTISVSRDAGHDLSHADVYVAIAHAFRAARRQLQDLADIQRGDVKLHA